MSDPATNVCEGAPRGADFRHESALAAGCRGAGFDRRRVGRLACLATCSRPGRWAGYRGRTDAGRPRHAGQPRLVGRGSKSQAHRLWDYYSRRRAYQGVKPRLLGISRVRLSGTSWDGVYWLVLSDRVYTPSFGPDTSACGYGREAVFVPDGSKSVSGNTKTF